MVRRRFFSAVSNHDARGPSFETREERAPQDEGGDCFTPSRDEVREFEPMAFMESILQPRARNFFWPARLSARTEEYRGWGSAMSDILIIEVGAQPAGIVVRNPDGYYFFAASHRFNPMEGQRYCNPLEAERAAIQLANSSLESVA
jgi:hypothetical protein